MAAIERGVIKPSLRFLSFFVCVLVDVKCRMVVVKVSPYIKYPSLSMTNLSSCPQDVKAQCYKTLVRPIIDYAASAGDPHTTSCIQQLEAVRRVARFVKGDYHSTSVTGWWFYSGQQTTHKT